MKILFREGQDRALEALVSNAKLTEDLLKKADLDSNEYFESHLRLVENTVIMASEIAGFEGLNYVEHQFGISSCWDL